MADRVSAEANVMKAMEVFVAVVETGQMTAAARLVGMTQSAASQQIASLERLYDAKLIDRSTRPLRPTQSGMVMHRHALRILNAAADLSADLRHRGPRPISTLRIGLLASIATTLTPALVGLARDGFGVDDITLHAGQSADHETLLRTKRADIAITSNPFDDMEGLERHEVLTESFLLVLPQSFNGDPTDLDQILAELPLVRFADTTDVGRRVRQHLRRLKLQPRQVIQADRSSMVTACVAEGFGFTFLTPCLLIDGLVERMPLALHPMPVAGMTRSITVVARASELGELPGAFAKAARKTLWRQISAQMGNQGVAALRAAGDSAAG